MVIDHQPIEVIHELGEDAQQIQDPFVIVYDEYGKFQGIKVPETENVWSKNIKQGIASMLQLDLAHIQLHSPMTSHSFVTQENTIHGNCQVAYNVQPRNPTDPETTNVFVVTKFHELRNCSHFTQRVFDHVECEKCHVESSDDMTTAARRVFQIEQQGGDILIRHLVAHSTVNHLPYNAQSEAHYLMTNTTLSLHSVVPVAETPASVVNFQNVPIIRDVTFNKPVGNYALHAAEDLTHGRHIVKLDALIPKLKKMLTEAADYIEENHLEAKEPEWKHGQTINRLQHTMSYMDLGSLEQVYNTIQDPKTPKEVTIKNIFLKMVPTVGTSAACHFTRNVIRKHKVTDGTAISMLIKLPMHVKVPSERLLLEMEELLKLDNTVSPQVRKSSILCFSILIRKTFMHYQGEPVNSLLQRYINRFVDHIMNEQTYEMKMVYLMAMKNVQVGNIEKFLEPIIRNPYSVSDKPHHIRVQAIWAIKKAVADKTEYTHDLLWPIFTDVKQPLSVRIAAYDVLMSQMPNMRRLMNIYWFMVYEQNNHLYNYHLTTLQGLANSVDPCLTPVRDMARKVVRYTKIRPVTTALSYKHFMDYTDPMYEHGESWNTAWVLDETTGLPHAGYVEHRVSWARRPVDKVGIYWSAYNLHEVMKIVKKELMDTKIENISNKNIQNILVNAAQDMPEKKPIHVDICITMNGQVIFASHYNQDSFKNMIADVHKLRQTVSGNFQDVMYDTFYEMQMPTDMGVQGILSTKLPYLLSFKFNNVQTEVKKPSVNVKVETDTRMWRHGEYMLSMYNPVADVWHSIRRAIVQDVASPVVMNFNYNHEAKNVKITYPRLPVTKMSHVGIRNHAKNLVTITEDEQDVLKTCCATCQHQTVVTTGNKKNYHVAMDSKDLGLRYSASIFDCENKVTPVSDLQEWHRAMSSEHKNTGDSKLMQYMMGIRQKMTNVYLSPEMGNCGMLWKTEPSIVYPTSHVDVNLRMNVENVDHLHEKMHSFNSKKINIRGTLDAKAASTNESVRSWDVNVNINMSQGHVLNNMKVQMKRVTPGEKNLKICVDAQKSYPVMDEDPLKIDTNKEETNAKVTVTAGFTDDDKCVRDEMVIAMTIKSEMTEEQKKQMVHDSVHGDCVKDIQNPQFQTRQGYVPKTMNCIHEVLKYTTMKKYTINASYKKVPVPVVSLLQSIDDSIRATYLPHVKYIWDRAENGNMKIMLEVSTDLNHLNATVVTPVSGYEYVQVPLHQGKVFRGIIMDQTISHPWMAEWHTALVNTHFTMNALRKMTQGLSKICTIYPEVAITTDNGVIQFPVPDEWTLVSGDHIDQSYAVFVKSTQNDKLAIKMYVAGHEMEVMPTESSATVTVDGNVVDQHEKGVMVPKGEPETYAIKLTENVGHLIVQSQRVPMMMMWTPNSVTMMLDTTLQGHVTGICGHMDGTHKEKLPKIYTAHV
ncbi:hypothetical protein DMN91_010110 [Ooceraea biroi]|nr:hypothetical protein DMN91_010110 [Ooceraea biroi]